MHQFFEISLKDSLSIILIKKYVFKLLKSKHDNEVLFNDLILWHSDLKIKSLLFTNTPECYSEKAYDNFVKESISLPIKNRFGEPVDYWDCNERYKENKILNQFYTCYSNYFVIYRS